MRTLQVLVKEATRKADGVKFNYYKVVEFKDNEAVYTDLRFRKEVTELPLQDCFIDVEDSDINYSTKGKYPCYWVNAIQKVIIKK